MNWSSSYASLKAKHQLPQRCNVWHRLAMRSTSSGQSIYVYGTVQQQIEKWHNTVSSSFHLIGKLQLSVCPLCATHSCLPDRGCHLQFSNANRCNLRTNKVPCMVSPSMPIRCFFAISITTMYNACHLHASKVQCMPSHCQQETPAISMVLCLPFSGLQETLHAISMPTRGPASLYSSC
jgi:hypothetical protein